MSSLLTVSHCDAGNERGCTEDAAQASQHCHSHGGCHRACHRGPPHGKLLGTGMQRPLLLKHAYHFSCSLSPSELQRLSFSSRPQLAPFELSIELGVPIDCWSIHNVFLYLIASWHHLLLCLILPSWQGIPVCALTHAGLYVTSHCGNTLSYHIVISHYQGSALDHITCCVLDFLILS